ncbi:sporozoite surface protein 2-like isoform X2 [Pieris napi]|uniref:sporozoite surface protein 2-like isoform X2 n=1 Tax=Pieris napi TaxID=78633 RepID=UPI001FBBD9AE|nr:sporozoite surface protein 2-like isoform X2 [Pieris napi]
MICIKLLLFCFLSVCDFGRIQGQLLTKESGFDLNSLFGNLFPNFGFRRNPQANYPGTSQYPINEGQLNNPQGNIWNNGNGNPGMNYPANSQYYPGTAIQGNYPQTSVPRQGWNSPQTLMRYPNQQGAQGDYPQTSLPGQGWSSPQTQTGYLNQQVPQGQQKPTGNENTWNNLGLPANPIQVNQPGQYPDTGRNWNGIGANVNSNNPNMPSYPQNGLQTGAAYSGQENAKNPNYYQPGNPGNDNVQKLNPNYPTANNWNNGLNPRVNYPGNPQPYPVNGIQTDVPNSWNANQKSNQGYESPSQLGYQGGQLHPGTNYQNGYPSQNGYPPQSDSYTGFRNEASQYPNQSEQADVAVTTEKAILGNPVIISEIKPPSTPKSEVDGAQTKCVQDCSTSSDYQPICGTNNVTYFNEEKFECAQKCGIEVAIRQQGACDGH